ncbi:c-type cytochrome [Schlegelella sp. S2-27]|uniref:C-type cytochrome n=1 Tax=Caldimonas mangrovi TaxID=2944811 RepID=A0ABT0YN37_9BURK|nr:c-type cytochrome [Caldimonas mangrovi]MCM5680127.1 c-type cytochrome [Caldimonas mangrovi]
MPRASLLLGLAAALLSGAGAAAAQPAGARVPDTIAERVRACTVCHGKEGRATNEGYFPRIAGKPAGYLYQQLLNFREGRRHYALMTYLVEHLSDDYLMEIAQYFSALDLPYPPPQTVAAAPEVLARGEALVLRGDPARRLPACVQCHGEALMGVSPAVPGLLGLPRDYLNGQLGAWKTGQRRAAAPDCMAKIAAALTPDEIASVSTWLSSQPVRAGAKPAGALPGRLPMPCGGVSTEEAAR